MCASDIATGQARLYMTRLESEDRTFLNLLKEQKSSPKCWREVILEQFVVTGIHLTSLDNLKTRKDCDQSCEECVCD